MAEKIKAHLIVSGLVKGVFFRDSTRLKAEELGVTGWVRNLSDGRVEIIAEGEKEKVEELVEWVKNGSSSARVDNLDVEWQEYVEEFTSFEIRY